MNIDSEPVLKNAARRNASFARHTEPVREFSNGKMVILAAVLIAAISGAMTLLILH